MEKNRKKRLLLAGTFGLALFFMALLWTLDISASAMLAKDGLTNGFYNADPVKIYHLSLYGLLAVIVALSMLVIYVVNEPMSPEESAKFLQEGGRY